MLWGGGGAWRKLPSSYGIYLPLHNQLDLGEVALVQRSHLQMNTIVKAPPEVEKVDLSFIIALFSG